MAVILSRFMGKISPSSNGVEVTITGTGGEEGCYVSINGTSYTSAATGIEVMSGDVIIFGMSGSLTNQGVVRIDGNVVLSVGNSEYITHDTYKWVVPDRIASVSIDLYAEPYYGGGSITVTTV